GAMNREIAAPARADLPRLPSESSVSQPKGHELENAGAFSEDSVTDKHPGPAKPEEEKPAEAELAAPKTEASSSPKAGMRRPNIFGPGPAPDDPGPRPSETDDVSTLLSRFRRPS